MDEDLEEAPTRRTGAAQRIAEAVLSWPRIESHPHRFGETECCLGRREIGHVHGNYLVDIPFPRKVREEIVAAGEAESHHILPGSGWVSLYLRREADTERAIKLLRRSYELALAQLGARTGASLAP
jgi:hypothetical protein